MTLLLSDDAVAARRSVAAGPLAPLAASLAADIEPLLGGEPLIPREKALLSREGGRCTADGALLDFDPFSPHAHRCPTCGRVYTGRLHDRFWLYWYQLWLAERAVHAALLATLGGDARHARLARDILLGYAERYADYPNVDNVLGPTRLFFSTYLESIWLLQLCVAADLLARGGDTATRDRVVERIVEPSAALVGSYDEGASNRQVWNNAALLASHLLLGRPAAAERAVFAESGLAFHLGAGLLADGTWYEGENYHLFAHRGLWYGVTMAEVAGIELPAALTARFQEGFATPFVAALPDLTLPSRRDSQYAISLRQWRFAELCELGLARADDERLAGALHHLYEDDVPRGDTGRARSSAEAERNVPASRLSRADLGWRSLLCARAELPPLHPVPPRSALLDAQGLAILRRDAGRVYVALDYGHSGGGHGHPDRLDLLLSRGATRWLDDMGTGSYVDPSLHWYRSTLAHNAPLVNGRSQRRVHGALLAYDERGSAAWVCAEAVGIAPGVAAARTLVVMPGYVVDELAWRAEREVAVDLPLHLEARVAGVGDRLVSAPLDGGDDLEDGFRFLRDTAFAAVDAGAVVAFDAAAPGGDILRGWCRSDCGTAWWRVVAPGPPGAGERPFWLIRAAGRDGAHRFVFDWSGDVADVRFDDRAITVRLHDGARHEHLRTDDGWKVTIHDGGTTTVVDLAGLVPDFDERSLERSAPAPAFATPPAIELRPGDARAFSLGERHYRRSEQTWNEAGRPTADVVVRWDGDALTVTVDVQLDRPLTFVPAGAVNPYDNEAADINGDGVQLYLATAAGLSAWVLVPDPSSSAVRARTVDGWTAEQAVTAAWSRTARGYRIEGRIPLDDRALHGQTIGLDVVVNEKPPERDRRRGQLVLSGAAEEFVYLRGDRHEPHRLLEFRLLDA